MTTATLGTDAGNDYRHRLLGGMAASVAQRGYADTTVADIVREAGVSKRTFYEHFATKSDCLVALYQSASHAALKVLKDAINPSREWQSQVEHALQAYLGCLAADPPLLRTLFIEILHLGQPGLAVRREMYQELADFVVQVVQAQPRQDAARAIPIATLAMAVVGGINELVLKAIEDNRTEHLLELAAPASALVRAVLSGTD